MGGIRRASGDVAVGVLLVLALSGVYFVDASGGAGASSDDASGELVVERSEEQVVDLPPAPLKLAVTPAKFDDMGQLLQTLGEGYSFEMVAERDLEDPDVCKQFDVVFLTCAEPPQQADESHQKLAKTLREYVGGGGTLYASDLRFDALSVAFPEFVDATAVAQGTQQDLRADVLDAGLREILGPELPLHFDLEGWRPAAFGGEPVTVYLKGNFQTTAGVAIEAPLLVKFPFGQGTVLFTSFHNEKQNNATELKLLKYLVFTTVTAKAESKVTKTMIAGGFAPQKQNLLSATPEDPSVTATYEHRQDGDLQFALAFERLGARLKLEVTSPTGTQHVKQGDSTFSISVPGAAAGTWRYTIVAEKLPYPNFPFALTVGAVTSDTLAGKSTKKPSKLPKGSKSRPPPLASGASGAVTFNEIQLEPVQKDKNWRIAVTPPNYDDMGKLLDALGEGFRYENLPMQAFYDPDRLASFDVIFLTCDSQGAGDVRLQQNMRKFVERGGTLYASDLRYPMIAAAFPEFLPQADDAQRAEIQVQIEETRRKLQELDPTADVPTVSEVLTDAGLSDSLRNHVDRVAAAMQDGDLTETTQPASTEIGSALADAGLPATAADVEKIAKALRKRALQVNRAKYTAKRDRGLAAKATSLNRRLNELREKLSQPFNLKIETGRPQHVQADVVDAGLQEVLGKTMELNFDAGGWIPAQFGGKSVTVYLRGTYVTVNGGQAEAPLLVKFPVGEGTVIFTAFHNEAQNSEQEEKLLRYLVFTAVTAKQEALVAKTTVSGGFSPVKRSVVSHSAGTPSVTRVYRNEAAGRLQFSLSFANQGARLRFTIVAPGGQTYEKEAESTVVVQVPNAPPGDWHYTVTALEVPYENFPFNVGVARDEDAVE